MPDYVRSYLQLEDRAAGAESKADEYRRRAEDNRWEQCRIASEAVVSGEFSQTSFAKAVGKSQQVVRRQCLNWANYGGYPLADRPSYAASLADGDGVASETDRKQISNARTVLKDPALARELMADPTARAVAAEAITAHHRAQPAPRAAAPSRDDAFLRCVDDMARVDQSLTRLIENLNEGRKNGFLTPAVLREFVEKLRLYGDAIEDIASSRGLTDEALAEWIGAE